METALKCLLSVLQLGAEPEERERLWQHLIQGADVRGNILMRKTLSLGFSKEPQRLSAHVLECVHEGQERNPGLLGFLLGLGKLFEGSFCHWDKPLCSICGLSR